MVDVALHQHIEIDHLGNTLVLCNRLATFSDDDAILEPKIKSKKDFYEKRMNFLKNRTKGKYIHHQSCYQKYTMGCHLLSIAYIQHNTSFSF